MEELLSTASTTAGQQAETSGGAAVDARRWWTVSVVTIATFMLLLDLTVVNVALPSLRTSLQADFTGLQWVIDSYALTLAVFLLTGGSLADIFGRKRVFTAGFVAFTAASLACGLAGSIEVLNLARGAQGIGAAVLFAVGPALIGQEFHGKERGVAFGIFGAGSGLAIALGPVIGGALTSGVGWRWIFLVNVPIGVVATALGMFGMRESRARRARTVDWSGVAVFSVALALLVLALLRGQAQGWGSPVIVAMFAGSAVALTAFVLIERSRGRAAMLDLSLFRTRTFAGISVVAALVAASAMSAIFLLISYVQNLHGFSPWQTGLRFLPLTVVLFVLAAVAGALTAKVPPQALVGLACVFIAAGLALVTPLVNVSSSWTALLPTMVCLGIGLGLFNPPRASISIAVVEPADAGTASGMNETFQQVGMAIGIAGFGALFEARVEHAFAASAGLPAGALTEPLGRLAAAGAVDQAGALAPPALAGQVAAGARSAFVAGLGDVLLLGSIVAAVAAVAAFALIRARDFHPSAVGSIPGVPPDLDDLDDPAPAR